MMRVTKVSFPILAGVAVTVLAAAVKTADGAELSAGNLTMARGDTAELLVFGTISGESTFGVTILVEIIPRGGNVGSVNFTLSPPVDIVQRGDAWPGAGTFTPFDTDSLGFSSTLNGSVDDNGTFLSSAVTYTGPLTGFPVTASSDAGGVWDVVLSTSGGDSGWEGLPTTLIAGTITVPPTASLSVHSRPMPPASIITAMVSGDVGGETTSSVDILLEIIPRVGNTGTLQFTAAFDIVELGNPWGAGGTFSAFDTGSPGFSSTLNGSVHGTFSPQAVAFSGDLTGFPIVASSDANGVWDLVLNTSGGRSGWDGVLTALEDGTITVTPEACVIATDCDDANVCTTDVCNDGVCEYTPAPGTCNDGDLCTINDACQAGVCVGTPVDCSALNDACNVGTCNAFTGMCEALPANDGGPCNDGVPCTENDTCLGGVCSGTPIDCSGLDDTCNMGTCNAATGVCERTPINEGGSCDDANICTLNDVCVNGACTGTPRDCSSLTDACHVGQCNGTTGLCEAVAANEGGPCNDNDLCTQNDICTAGSCAGTPVDCSGLNDACNLGSCNPATGACARAPANQGGPCDDADRCTQNDTCSAGVCSGTPTDCSALNDTCNVGTCNPATGSCGRTPANQGGSCNDANVCTLNDVCTNGTCAGTPRDCSALNNACNLGQCNTTTGLCGAVPANEGGLCNDNNLCTLNDRCATGVCVGTPVDCSSLNNACNVGTCNTATGACQRTPTNEGGSCNDGNPCTANDICSAGTCAGSSIPGCQNCTVDANCNDNNACTSDACVGGACQHTNLTSSCNDNNLCTQSDTCSGGVCVGTPVNCSALNDACHVGVCVPGTGACHADPANNGGPCNDGYPCTINDVCQNGTCSGTPTTPSRVNLTWSPSTQSVPRGPTFTVDLIASSSNCLTQPVGSVEVILSWNPTFLELFDKQDTGALPWMISNFPDDSGVDGLNEPFSGVPDNDGDALYQALTAFQSGAQIPPGGAVVTRFVFRALDGTTGTNLTVPPTAGAFTRSRVLGAGPILGQDITGTLGSATVQVVECQSNPDCNDSNVCTTDVCTTGVCVYTNNTLSCSDGLFCTSPDTCSNGTCVGGVNPCSPPLHCSESLDACVQCLNAGHCSDGNVCTNDVCSAAGSCSNPNNTASCNDGLFCTLTDQCSGGVCVGTGNRCPGQVCDEPNDRCVQCLSVLDCNDNNVCTTDGCTSNLCTHVNNTLSCNDGLFCTVTDTCSGGACIGAGARCTPPMVCSEALDACVRCEIDAHCNDGNLCTTDVCFFNTCSNSNNIAPCDDGLFCTPTDRCSGGTCVGSGDRCPGQLCDEPGDRCVDCFTLADCPGETVACTVDSCANGACLHTPDSTRCDDVQYCNGPEFCHLTLDCRPGIIPCDDGSLCQEATDACGCQQPVALAEGSRYLAVTPRSGATPVALVVTGVNPDVACVSRYVQSDGTLGTTPVFKTPGGPGGWGTAHVRGTQILPNRTYLVQTECDTGPAIGRSTTVQDTTWLWGDSNDSGGLVDVIDVTNVLNGYQGSFGRATRYSVDLWGASGSDCRPQLVIDILDVVSMLNAFSRFPFGCAAPCP